MGEERGEKKRNRMRGEEIREVWREREGVRKIVRRILGNLMIGVYTLNGLLVLCLLTSLLTIAFSVQYTPIVNALYI